LIGNLIQSWTGRTIYEWDQSVDEVNMYIAPPKGLRAKDFTVKIDVSHIEVGLKGNPPYLNVRTFFTFVINVILLICCFCQSGENIRQSKTLGIVLDSRYAACSFFRLLSTNCNVCRLLGTC
jgi:hypothetical protein